MEPFPDLTNLPDQELRDLIHEFERQENEISYQRRLLHGKIGLLKAELVARLQKQGGQYQVDIDKLTDILTGKGPAIPESKPPEPRGEGPQAAA